MLVSEVSAFRSESHIKYTSILYWKKTLNFLTLNLMVNIVTTGPQRVGEARWCDWYNDYATGWASKELWFDYCQRQRILFSLIHPHRL
jgi:hypothetical protein